MKRQKLSLQLDLPSQASTQSKFSGSHNKHEEKWSISFIRPIIFGYNITKAWASCQDETTTQLQRDNFKSIITPISG